MLKQLLLILGVALLVSTQSFAQRDGLSRQADSEIRDAINEATDGKKLLGNTADRLGKLVGVYKSAREMYDGLQSLKKAECLPDYSVNPQAMVPSSCDVSVNEAAVLRNDPIELAKIAASSKCAKCYEEAYKKLTDARKRLGKLKCLGLTTKEFVTKQVSFGDTVSGIHALQGLAWQKERRQIMDAYTKFKDAYDRKYKELMDLLNESMISIDKCEAENGQKDWYQRFGFMYVEFMAEKYKRVE